MRVRRWLRRFHALHDENTGAFFAFMVTARWLGFRLDMMCFSLLLVACYAAALSHAFAVDMGSGVNAGLIGAALMLLVQLAGLFQWTVRQTAELENQMVSVERLLAFHVLPQEVDYASAAPPPLAPLGPHDRGRLALAPRLQPEARQPRQLSRATPLPLPIAPASTPPNRPRRLPRANAA